MVGCTVGGFVGGFVGGPLVGGCLVVAGPLLPASAKQNCPLDLLTSL